VTWHAWLLLSWIVAGAAMLLVHAVVLYQVFWARDLPRRHRPWALIPVAAPVLAWIDGRRVAPLIWVAVLITYLALRALEGI